MSSECSCYYYYTVGLLTAVFLNVFSVRAAVESGREERERMGGRDIESVCCSGLHGDRTCLVLPTCLTCRRWGGEGRGGEEVQLSFKLLQRSLCVVLSALGSVSCVQYIKRKKSMKRVYYVVKSYHIIGGLSACTV